MCCAIHVHGCCGCSWQCNTGADACVCYDDQSRLRVPVLPAASAQHGTHTQCYVGHVSHCAAPLAPHSTSRARIALFASASLDKNHRKPRRLPSSQSTLALKPTSGRPRSPLKTRRSTSKATCTRKKTFSAEGLVSQKLAQAGTRGKSARPRKRHATQCKCAMIKQLRSATAHKARHALCSHPPTNLWCGGPITHVLAAQRCPRLNNTMPLLVFEVIKDHGRFAVRASRGGGATSRGHVANAPLNTHTHTHDERTVKSPVKI